MRSTLFFIPHEFLGIPLFGLGWALLALALGCVGWLAWTFISRRPIRAAGEPSGVFAEVANNLPMWGVAAVLVTFVLPNIEQTLPGTALPIGLPIRGYGVLVLLGLLSGIGITVYRGRFLGVSSDVIVGLGFWMMLGGVAGARIFYVVQKWDSDYSNLPSWEKLVSIVKLTEGGLVIYGGVMGGIVAGIAYCRKNQLPVRAFGDLIAPGFLIGAAFGRIGCLLNGCCFGGICTDNLPAIQFPQGSGPYMVQLESGKLLGIELASRSEIIEKVQPGSLADGAGIRTGSTLKSVHSYLVPLDATSDPAAPPKVMADVAVDQSVINFATNQLPAYSLPLHPSQIYAAIDAALLCWLVWCIQPWPKWDGMTFLIAILLHTSSRFLLEGIRSDEAGQLGTTLSIAQLISIGGAAVALVLIFAIRQTPPGRVWNWSRVAQQSV